MKKAFTLAEIMIVLGVIGVLTAVLLPASKNLKPDEKVLKFKTTHNAVMSAVRELATSDKYFLDGNLRIKAADGTCAGSHYLVNAFADVLGNKKTLLSTNTNLTSCTPVGVFTPFDSTLHNNLKSYMDTTNGAYGSEAISDRASSSGNSGGVIVLSNGVQLVVCYGASNELIYVMQVHGYDITSDNTFSDTDGDKIKAITDGTFSYAITKEGKVITSNKVDQWLEKSINAN